MDQNFFKWKNKPKAPRGVVCGAEKAQEWLLPWWWERFREFNDLPVVFFDFGMSEEMKDWCRERGELISVPFEDTWVAQRGDIDREIYERWAEDSRARSLCHSRRAWFKKPIALLHSPFKQTLWLDLDCEVLGSIKPLFAYCNSNSQMGIVREYRTDHLPQLDPGVFYNGGVVVFEHGAPIIEKWAKGAIFSNRDFLGDDQLLSHLIYEHRLEVAEMPEDYNWRLARGLNLCAVILHWVGNGGKEYIRANGGFKPMLDAFYHACRTKI